MDPITTAIVAALSAGTIAGLTDTTKTAITESYHKLKGLLTKKHGEGSDVVQAIEKLETKPESQRRKDTLQEKIAAVKAERDDEILAAARQVLTLVQAQQAGMGKFTIQNDGLVQGQNIGDYQHSTQHFGEGPKEFTQEPIEFRPSTDFKEFTQEPIEFRPFTGFIEEFRLAEVARLQTILHESQTENTEKAPETTIKQIGGNATLQIRIDEEPLTALSLASTLTNFITLYTTYWLIQQERFDDALQYANHGGKHFEEETNLIIGELKYNSPADIKFNIDLSPESFINALKNLIDTIVQIKHRRKVLELENRAREIENRDKEVELNQKMQNYAIDEIEKLIELSSKIDASTSVALKQRLAEQVLQLCSNSTVQITLLLPDTSTKQEQETDNSLHQHINHAKEQSGTIESLPSLPEGNSFFAEPIATAIVTALSIGAIANITDTTKTAVTNSYNKLKELLTKKYGADSDVTQAIKKLEAKPESQGYKQVLQEEITAIKAEQDEEILATAKQILTLMKSQQTSMGKSNIQNNGYAQGQNIGDHQHITQHIADLSKIEK